MEVQWRRLEPWLRKLTVVLEAVRAPQNVVEDARYRRLIVGLKLEDVWVLRLKMPRQSSFSMERWQRRGRRSGEREGESQHAGLRAIREAIDLLMVVRSIDENAWTLLLVNRCGVGGDDVPGWSRDSKILPVLRLQPHFSDWIEDVLYGVEQCEFLLVKLQDEASRSAEFRALKSELLAHTTPSHSVESIQVHLSNWLSPRAQLTCSESDELWRRVCDTVLSARRQSPTGIPSWHIESLDVHVVRFALTFDAAMAILKIVDCGVSIGELCISAAGHSADHFTGPGVASVLRKLFTQSTKVHHFRVDGETCPPDRLEALGTLLTLPTMTAAVSLERYAMDTVSIDERTARFEWLARCLTGANFSRLNLDIPNLSMLDVTAFRDVSKDSNHPVTSRIESLVLTVDCREDSWLACCSLLRLFGSQLRSLELSIHGDTLPIEAIESVLKSCGGIQKLTLHRAQLESISLLAECLQKPTCQLESLVLSRLHAPLNTIVDLGRLLANPARCNSINHVELDLSELSRVGDAAVAAFSTALRHNPYVRSLTLVLDSDVAGTLSDDVHDDFYLLHNQILIQPVRPRARLAFLSIFSSRMRPLSPLPISMIFKYASSRSRRVVSIREAHTAW